MKRFGEFLTVVISMLSIVYLLYPELFTDKTAMRYSVSKAARKAERFFRDYAVVVEDRLLDEYGSDV